MRDGGKARPGHVADAAGAIAFTSLSFGMSGRRVASSLSADLEIPWTGRVAETARAICVPCGHSVNRWYIRAGYAPRKPAPHMTALPVDMLGGDTDSGGVDVDGKM